MQLQSIYLVENGFPHSSIQTFLIVKISHNSEGIFLAPQIHVRVSHLHHINSGVRTSWSNRMFFYATLLRKKKKMLNRKLFIFILCITEFVAHDIDEDNWNQVSFHTYFTNRLFLSIFFISTPPVHFSFLEPWNHFVFIV